MVLAKMKIITPSTINRADCQMRRPLIPILLLALSEMNPPIPRANKFIHPKIDAMAAALSVVSSNLDLK